MFFMFFVILSFVLFVMARSLQSSLWPPAERMAIKKLDDDYNKTIEHYRAITQERRMLLRQK